MRTASAPNTDLRVVQRVLDTEHVQLIQRFKQVMGLWYWGPSLILATILGVFLSHYQGTAYAGLSIAMCALSLCALGWFARFYHSGKRASGLMTTLHSNVPWDSLRRHAESSTELDRINTLEGFMACEPSQHRAMSVMPMLIALVSIMETVVQRSTHRAEH